MKVFQFVTTMKFIKLHVAIVAIIEWSGSDHTVVGLQNNAKWVKIEQESHARCQSTLLLIMFQSVHLVIQRVLSNCSVIMHMNKD